MGEVEGKHLANVVGKVPVLPHRVVELLLLRRLRVSRCGGGGGTLPRTLLPSPRQGSIAAQPRHVRAQRQHISTARLPPRYSHAVLSVKYQYPRFQRTLRVPQGHPGDGAWVQPERRAAVKRGVHTNAQRASGGVCPDYGECVTAQPLLLRGGWIHRIRVQRAGYVEQAMHPRLVRRADRRAISHARMEVKDERDWVVGPSVTRPGTRRPGFGDTPLIAKW